MTAHRRRPKLAFILAGGAARGAYEVGVLQYLVERVAPDVGVEPRVDVLCGTSVGAINACALAAFSDDVRLGVEALVGAWTSLELEAVVRPRPSEVFALVGDLLGRKRKPPQPGEERRGGLLDPGGIEQIVTRTIPFERIGMNLAQGNLDALAVSATAVATGVTNVFVQTRGGRIPRWSQDLTVCAEHVTIGPDHALASAAIPMLFPAVRLGETFYCDGGLRQNVPLSPARRLGAERLLVVNPRYVGPPTRHERAQHVASYPSPLFLLGKALNALLLDRIDADIDRLHRINAVLEAGRRAYGDSFVTAINDELEKMNVSALYPLDVVHVRASDDIGELAGEFVRSETFARRAPGALAALLRRISDWEGSDDSDLVSYMLFDGEFAGQLIALGYRDASLVHDDLCALVSE